MLDAPARRLHADAAGRRFPSLVPAAQRQRRFLARSGRVLQRARGCSKSYRSRRRPLRACSQVCACGEGRCSFELQRRRDARASSASRARASRRVARCVARLWSPAPVDMRSRILFKGRNLVAGCGVPQPVAGNDPDGVPGPVRVAEPAPTGWVAAIAGGPIAQGVASGRGDGRARSSCCELVGLDADAADALSARVLRRSAPAHRHRAGAGDATRAAGRRRARVRARRFGAGTGARSVRAGARAASGSRWSSSRTICAWPPRCATTSR